MSQVKLAPAVQRELMSVEQARVLLHADTLAGSVQYKSDDLILIELDDRHVVYMILPENVVRHEYANESVLTYHQAVRP